MRDILFPSHRGPVSWVPPTGRILAYFHGGRIFTETLPRLGMVILLLQSAWLGLWWISHWGEILRHYERWRLVGAALAHMGLLAVAYLFLRIIWLRLDQLKRLPPGEGAALRSYPILLRVTGEAFFVLAVGLSLHQLVLPDPSSPPAFDGSGAFSTVGESLGNPLLALTGGIGLTFSIALYSLLLLVFFYGLANLIETYQSLELNTRPHGRKKQPHVTYIAQHPE